MTQLGHSRRTSASVSSVDPLSTTTGTAPFCPMLRRHGTMSAALLYVTTTTWIGKDMLSLCLEADLQGATDGVSDEGSIALRQAIGPVEADEFGHGQHPDCDLCWA